MEMKVYFPGGEKVNAQYKGFTIETDQAKENGGDESAPEPFSLFLDGHKFVVRDGNRR